MSSGICGTKTVSDKVIQVSFVQRNFAIDMGSDPDVILEPLNISSTVAQTSSSTGTATAPIFKRTRTPTAPSDHKKRQQAWTIITQEDARPELALLSQPYGETGLPSQLTYQYDMRGGDGVTIYIVDTGLVNYWDITDLYKRNSAEAGRLDWIFPEPDELSVPWATPESANQNDGKTFHGTRMAIKAVGEYYGVAKWADLIVVRLPVARDKNLFVSFKSMINSFNAIVDRIEDDSSAEKAVINMSFGSWVFIFVLFPLPLFFTLR